MILIADIGGTHTRIAVSKKGESFSPPLIFPTPKTAEEGFVRIREFAVAQGEKEGEEYSCAVIGIAGVFSPDRQTLVSSPHLSGWVGECTAARASQFLGIPVYFENDAALGALGEAVRGAGKGADIVAYVTVGTGVGGARVTQGALDKTHFGFEIGHQLISMNGEVNELEAFVSGNAFPSRHGNAPREVRDPLVWQKVAQDLADGLYNTLLHWSPDVLVLGGSMMKDIPLSTIKERLFARVRIFPSLPEIRRGVLGDSCGLYGALAFARPLEKRKQGG